MAQLFTFARKPAFETADWTNREIAELYRVEAALCAARLSPQTERGITDEGDPWFVFCRADGEPIVHITRSGGLYRLFSPVLPAPITGASFDEITRQFIGEMPVRLTSSARVVIHPSALLSVLVGTLFFLLEGLDSPEAEAAEVLGGAAFCDASADGADQGIGSLLAAGLFGRNAPGDRLDQTSLPQDRDGLTAFERYVSLVGALVVVASSAEIASYIARTEAAPTDTDLTNGLVAARATDEARVDEAGPDDGPTAALLRRTNLASGDRSAAIDLVRDEDGVGSADPEGMQATVAPGLPALDLRMPEQVGDLAQGASPDWARRLADMNARADAPESRTVFSQDDAMQAVTVLQVQQAEPAREANARPVSRPGAGTAAQDGVLDELPHPALPATGIAVESLTLVGALSDLTARAISGQMSASLLVQQITAIVEVWDTLSFDLTPATGAGTGTLGADPGFFSPVFNVTPMLERGVLVSDQADAVGAWPSQGSILTSPNGTQFSGIGASLDLELTTDYVRGLAASLFTQDSVEDIQEFFANADGDIERIVDDGAIVLIDRSFMNAPRGFVDIRKFGLEGGMTITLVGYFDAAGGQIGL